MSAPLSGSAGGSPTPGYYPDPSIPGYIRYWNGAAWVPGTSRPAPAEGEAMPAPPPGAAAVAPPPAAAPPAAGAASPVEETGPVFFDEEEDSAQTDGPAETDALVVRDRGEVDVRPAVTSWDDPRRLHGNSPEPASAWQADASHQSGFGGEQDRKVSWGSVPAPRDAGAGPGAPAEAGPWGDAPGSAATTDGTATKDADRTAEPAEESGAGRPAEGAPRDGTVAIRAVRPGADTPPAGEGASKSDGTMGIRAVGPAKSDGTVAIRAVRPGGTGGSEQGGEARPTPGDTGRADGTMAIRLDHGGARADQGRPAPAAPAAPQPPAAQAPAPDPALTPPGYGYPQQSGAQVPQQGAPAYGYPQQGAPAAPQHAGPAYGYPQPGGQPAPQSGAPENVAPWKPPVDNPFLSAAQEGRPAALGRRFAARLIDSVVLYALVAIAAVPLWGASVEHIDGKVEAARQSGVQTTVYLLDGTTGGYLAVVLAVLLVGGLLLEALPTAKWGWTLGKKVCGLKVLDIEEHDTPGFGAAAKRWLVYGVLGVLVVGVVNAAWCLFDRPWRQCWHDKVARTFVAQDQ